MTDSLSPAHPFFALTATAVLARAIHGGRRYHVLALLVLAAGLAATYQLSSSSQKQVRHQMQANFDFSVREAVGRIEQRMAASEHLLHSVQGFMSHADGITRDKFRHFVDKLNLEENYPGIQAIEFAKIVPVQQKARHSAAIRSEGAYAIHHGRERAPFPVRNLRDFGHAPYFETVHRATMEFARDFDVPVISGKVRLSQEDKQKAQAGFMMYLPVFQFGAAHRTLDERRANLIGWVSGAFRMDDLMNNLPGEEATRLDILIFDGDEMSPSTLMYDSNHVYVDHKPDSGLFQAIRRFEIANHTWSIQVRSRSAFDAELDRDSPRLISYGGIGISLLLALLTLVLANGRERALHAARQMNRELIESETRYRQMFQDSASIAYLLDPDTGRIIDANAAAAKYTGYSLAQLRSMHIGEINTATRECIMEVIQQVREGKRSHTEWRHQLQNGELRDVEVVSCPLAYKGKVLLHSIVHDISARKQGEAALRYSRSELRKLADHQQSVREDERKRIARDIHDELGQNLLALKMDVATLAVRTAKAHPNLHQRTSLVLHTIDATIQSVKLIMNNLRPATLALGLYPAIEWQLKQFELRNGIACKLMVCEQETTFGLDEAKTAAIFRILQESLVNVARHAEATEVEIALRQDLHGFSMQVKDNGKGFLSSDRRKANSFGLMGIKERIHALGGKLVTASSPGQGTALTISIPANENGIKA